MSLQICSNIVDSAANFFLIIEKKFLWTRDKSRERNILTTTILKFSKEHKQIDITEAYISQQVLVI